MGLILAGGAKAETTRNEPVVPSRSGWTAVGGNSHSDRQATLPVGTKPFNAVAFFAPILWIALEVTRKRVFRVTFPSRSKVAGHIAFVTFRRHIVNVAGQIDRSRIILALRNHMKFLPAFATETGRVQAVPGRLGIFQLTFEQDISGPFGERCEYLTRTRNEAMQFEGEERSRPASSTISLWKADAGQKLFEGGTADALVCPASALLRQIG